jgi:hypothetical protein
MDVPAFHLPDALDLPQPGVVAERDGVRALAPALSPAHARDVCVALRHAGATLRDMPIRRIIDAADAASRTLLQPDTEPQLVSALVAFTGYAPEMAELVLRRMARDWTAAALIRLVTAEFGSPEAPDSFADRPGAGRARPVPPGLAFHVFAGNVPGVSVTSIIRSLLVRSPVLGKPAAGEPVLAPAFARALAAADPQVGACVAICWWPGGSVDIEAAVLEHADIVVHYGGAAAIASLRQRAPDGVPFIDHGPRISFALAAADAAHGDALASLAHDMAQAVATFDQQGCVSPQMLYVIGEPADARRVARAVADRMADVARALPRGRLEPGEAAAIRELRSSAEFRAIAGHDVELLASSDLAWSVVFDADPVFSGSCLNRTLVVKCVPSLDDLADVTRPVRHWLQTVGVAGFHDSDELARRLGAMGATRITPIAAMPWPPVAWHHDGRGPLTELVRWLDLET